MFTTTQASSAKDQVFITPSTRHWTKTKISCVSCLPNYDISSHFLHILQRIGQNLCKQMKCVENLALSYRFPTCTKSKFLSSEAFMTLCKTGSYGDMVHMHVVREPARFENGPTVVDLSQSTPIQQYQTHHFHPNPNPYPNHYYPFNHAA